MSVRRMVSIRGRGEGQGGAPQAMASRALVPAVKKVEVQRISERPRLRSVGPTIIKRYQNRKLYDTRYSCYVTLHEVAKMIRAGEEIKIIDNKSKADITPLTLIQIIFDAERAQAHYAPITVLRSMIQNGDGSMSNYLEQLGAFSTQRRPGPRVILRSLASPSRHRPRIGAPLTLDERIVAAATPHASASSAQARAYHLPHPRQAGGK